MKIIVTLFVLAVGCIVGTATIIRADYDEFMMRTRFGNNLKDTVVSIKRRIVYAYRSLVDSLGSLVNQGRCKVKEMINR